VALEFKDMNPSVPNKKHHDEFLTKEQTNPWRNHMDEKPLWNGGK
jgi:hypothetical protein